MNRKAVLRTLVFVMACGLAASLPALTDDSAAAIAAGGVVPRRETRIVMAREVLQISLKKVVVDYDFRNDTAEDVKTEVAFPVPPYDWGVTSMPPSITSFPDFRLSIDGKPASYQSDAKAIINGKDVADILVADGIDVASFGHADDDVRMGRDLIRLPEGEKKRLAAMGIIDLDNDNNNTANGYIANWEVHLQYHWTQRFPAHSTVHIRHEYSPFAGFASYYFRRGDEQKLLDVGKISVDESKPIPLKPDDRGDITSFCMGLPLAKSMVSSIHQVLLNNPSDPDLYAEIEFQWVDFILTSANTWRRPIEDFTLIVERPKPVNGGKVFVSFCSPGEGAVEKTDVNLFQVHLTNFVPVSELHIGFFEVPPAKAAQPSVK